MNVGTLHEAIAAVCPIISVSMGDTNNRATWTYEAAPEATQPQKTAADNVIATIPVAGEGACLLLDFITRFTDAEYVVLYKTRITDTNADQIGYAKLWDLILAEGIVNMNKQSVKDLKAALVSKSVLTQPRADAIFSTTGEAGTLMSVLLLGG